jgi:hypothetical protein
MPVDRVDPEAAGRQPSPISPPAILRRLSPVLVSQAASSGTNVLAAAVAAASGSQAEFGSASHLFLAYFLSLSLLRSSAGLRLQLMGTPSATGMDGPLVVLRGTAGIGVLGGLVWLPLLVCISPGRSMWDVGVLALALPGLLLFDVRRYHFAALGRGWRAAGIDVAWLCSFLILVGLMSRLSMSSPTSVTYGWLLTGAALGLVTNCDALRGWTLDAFGVTCRLLLTARPHLLGALLVAVPNFGLLLLVGSYRGVDELGAYRTAEIPFGLVVALQSALVLVVQPSMARMHHERRRQFRLATAMVAATVASSVAIGAVLMALPGAGVPSILLPWSDLPVSAVIAASVKHMAFGPIFALTVLARGNGFEGELHVSRVGLTVAAVGAGLATSALAPVPMTIIASFSILGLGYLRLLVRALPCEAPGRAAR